MRVGPTSQVYGGTPPLPPSDEIILNVAAQLGVAIGFAAYSGELDKVQISTLIAQLQGVTDKQNQGLAQGLIGELAAFETTGNLQDLLNANHMVTNFLHSAPPKLTSLITDTVWGQLAYGQLGLAVFCFQSGDINESTTFAHAALNLLGQGNLSASGIVDEATSFIQAYLMKPNDGDSLVSALGELFGMYPP